MKYQIKLFLYLFLNLILAIPLIFLMGWYEFARYLGGDASPILIIVWLAFVLILDFYISNIFLKKWIHIFSGYILMIGITTIYWLIVNTF